MNSASRQNVNRLDAIEILKDDHEQFRELFQSYENLILETNVVEKEQLVSLVSNELIIHTPRGRNFLSRRAKRDAGALSAG